MKLKFLREEYTLQSALANIGLAVGIILLLGLAYFYIILPNATKHGEEVRVPDLNGKGLAAIDSILNPQGRPLGKRKPEDLHIHQPPHAAHLAGTQPS